MRSEQNPGRNAFISQKVISNFLGEGQRRSLSPQMASVCRWGSAAAAVFYFGLLFLYPQQIFFRSSCLGFFLSLTFIIYSPPGGFGRQVRAGRRLDPGRAYPGASAYIWH